jgi:hypothetical protein
MSLPSLANPNRAQILPLASVANDVLLFIAGSHAYNLSMMLTHRRDGLYLGYLLMHA